LFTAKTRDELCGLRQARIARRVTKRFGNKWRLLALERRNAYGEQVSEAADIDDLIRVDATASIVIGK
jgi:hypothetical protein